MCAGVGPVIHPFCVELPSVRGMVVVVDVQAGAGTGSKLKKAIILSELIIGYSLPQTRTLRPMYSLAFITVSKTNGVVSDPVR